MISERSKPHGLTKARSSSSQPAMPVRQRAAEHPGHRLGELAGQRAAVDVVDEVAQRRADLLARDRARARPRTARGTPRARRASGRRRRTPRRSRAPCRRGSRAPRRRTARRRPGSRRLAAIRQQRRARQRVRAAARPAERDEAVEAQLVEDRRDVGGRVGHAAALAAGRAGVARPRVGDELPAALVERVGQQRELVGRVRRADVEDQHAAVRRAVPHDLEVSRH